MYKCPDCNIDLVEQDCPECDGLGDLGGEDGPGEMCETCDGLGTLPDRYECLNCGRDFSEDEVAE